MQDGGFPLIRRFFSYATQANQAVFFKFSRLTDFLVQVLQYFDEFVHSQINELEWMSRRKHLQNTEVP